MSKLSSHSNGQKSLFSFFKKVPDEKNAPVVAAAEMKSGILTPNTKNAANKLVRVEEKTKNIYSTDSHSVIDTKSAAEMPINSQQHTPIEKIRVVEKSAKDNSKSNCDSDGEWDDDCILPIKRKKSVIVDELEDSDSEKENSDWSLDYSDSEEEQNTKRKRLVNKNKSQRKVAKSPTKVPLGTKEDNNTVSRIQPKNDPPSSLTKSRSTPTVRAPSDPSCTPSSIKSFSSAPTPEQLNLNSATKSSKGSPSTPSSSPENDEDDSIDRITNSSQEPLSEGLFGYGSHEHHQWDFYKKNRRDANNLRPDHVDYNPRTMYVPPSFMKDQTPAMKQWMEFKCKNMDTILFFKVGKFYELFHMDADVGVKELDLIYMKGSKAHSGFPEVAYGKFSNVLISKGYRVARIEQTETPEMLKERNKSAARGTSSKVVSREICSMVSKGTRTYDHLCDSTSLEEYGSGQSSSILLCLKEAIIDSSDNSDDSVAVVEYGVCLVDTALGCITLGQFQDNDLRNRLRTLIARYRPTEVALENNGYSAETSGVLRMLVPDAAREILRGAEEMPSAEDTLAMLERQAYFNGNTKTASNNKDMSRDDEGSWPPVLAMTVRGMQDGASNLAMSALGAALWLLSRSLIDDQLMSLGRFYAYIPPDETEEHNFTDRRFLSASADAQPAVTSTGQWTDAATILSDDLASPSQGDSTQSSDFIQEGSKTTPKHMILDSIALANLEVLTASYDGTEKGSLWKFMDRCRTPFGKRLLRTWVCSPLYRVHEIKSRAEAVNELLNSLSTENDKARNLFKNVVDLERLLSRVHSNGSKKRSMDHPDSRAVMFEANIYNARKIKDFADILSGFEKLLAVSVVFQNSSINSPLLTRITKSTSNGGCFPDIEMKKLLKFFREIFDEKQAKVDGTIKPKPGIDSEYDNAKAEIQQIENKMEEYLKEQKRKTGISDIKYFGTNKDRYQLEVPMAQCNKVPRDWSTKTQKKTHRRYWTSFIETSLAELMEAENNYSETV